jgi:hypothetical protein
MISEAYTVCGMVLVTNSMAVIFAAAIGSHLGDKDNLCY